MTIVRSIDTGYGNTKFVRDFKPISNTITTALFPSIAAKANSSSLAGDGEFLARRKTRVVQVSDWAFEVGQDVVQARGGSETGRELTTDYCLSDIYLALCRGALAEMDVREIDALVLGLPMSTWQSKRPALAERMTGRHQIDAKTAVDVKKVIVVPQPLGGFYDHAFAQSQFATMKSQVNLIVDPGYFTLDWLLCEGTKPIDGRSGAVNDGGMASVLADVVRQLEVDRKLEPGELSGNARMVERVDAALRGEDNVRIFGQSLENIDRLLEVARKRCAEPLGHLLKSVGNAADIDNIILCGGGSHIYLPMVQQRFPRHQVQVAADPVYGNVRGFQILGQIWAKTNLSS